MWTWRRIGLSALASVVALSLAPIASGDPQATSASASTSTHAKPHAKSKRKKHRRRTITTLSPRTGAPRLAFAAAPSNEESLINELLLPPARSGSCPPEMASIERRFCVDRWEASLVEIEGTGERPFSPFTVVEGQTVRAVSAAGVFPQGYVSGTEAAQACARSGKRLCSPNEWRKACVGPDELRYGYADTRERGRCNDAGRSPMRIVWGLGSNSSPKDWDPLKMNDPRLNQLEGSLARTGSHPDCSNDYGVYDMVGNLHEWTSDPSGTFQGGYYLDTTINGEGCAYRTTAHDFGYHDYSTGFRCCADPR
ncbi:MAG TPA: SUMF1/EgtB/PvdO family nonheme iron enzyme [Polyangiaceae bacterium]|jgi:hypothetical protein